MIQPYTSIHHHPYTTTPTIHHDQSAITLKSSVRAEFQDIDVGILRGSLHFPLEMNLADCGFKQNTAPNGGMKSILEWARPCLTSERERGGGGGREGERGGGTERQGPEEGQSERVRVREKEREHGAGSGTRTEGRRACGRG